MGVRVTDEEHVALFDSTAGEAFGPIFDNKFQAEHFLAWHEKCAEKGELFQYGAHKVQFAPDVRVYSNRMLVAVHQIWESRYENEED